MSNPPPLSSHSGDDDDGTGIEANCHLHCIPHSLDLAPPHPPSLSNKLFFLSEDIY